MWANPTLTNQLVGEKVAIVTNKPQTTRNRITAVLNHGETQFVFMDTPGFPQSQKQAGEYMVRIAGDSVAGVDAVALLVEPIDSIGAQEQELIEKIRKKTACRPSL
jgi:GTP-binding protein Era